MFYLDSNIDFGSSKKTTSMIQFLCWFGEKGVDNESELQDLDMNPQDITLQSHTLTTLAMTQLGMNPNWVNIWFHLGNPFYKKWVLHIDR
jgi:hypothetical protein